jgi:hypothetical protein
MSRSEGSDDSIKALLREGRPPTDLPHLRLYLSSSINWQARYNAACYYSRRAAEAQNAIGPPARLIEALPEGGGRAGAQAKVAMLTGTIAKALAEADALLKQVLRDPVHGVTGQWLRADPDLTALRAWPGLTAMAPDGDLAAGDPGTVLTTPSS